MIYIFNHIYTKIVVSSIIYNKNIYKLYKSYILLIYIHSYRCHIYQNVWYLQS